jgi:hypothetical protein
MKRVIVLFGVLAVGAAVLAARRREQVADSAAARAVADRVASGADRAADVSRRVTGRLQTGVLRTADTVGSAAESVVGRVDEAAAAAATAAEAADAVVAGAADRVAVTAVEATSTPGDVGGAPGER